MKREAERTGKGDVADDSLEGLVVSLSCSKNACGEEAVREGEVGSDGNQLEDGNQLG